MEERIKNVLETRFNIETMTIEQLAIFYSLYEKVNNKKKGDK